MTAHITAVCISKKTGEKKIPVDSVELKTDYGIVGDVHAGTGRQVSLLAVEKVDVMRAKMPSLADGDFAENFLTHGLPLEAISLGTVLKLGEDVVLEVTQIGKKCHSKCNIHKTVGYCIMPTQGVFAKVISGGTVNPGDQIQIV